MHEMLPANIDDPRFAPRPDEPLAARLAQDALDGVDDTLDGYPNLLEGLTEFGLRVVEAFVHGLAHR
jgi:hypothetical protein